MKHILSIIIFLPLLVIFGDFRGSPETIVSRIGIHSEMFLLFSILMFIFLRISWQFMFGERIRKILLVSSILLLLVSIVMSFIDFLTPSNYVYSHTLLNADKIFYFALSLGILGVGSLPNYFFSKHYKSLIFLLSIIIIAIGEVAWSWDFEKMYYLTKEDSLTEYLQFFALLFGAVYSFKLAKNIFSSQKILAVLYAFLSIGLLLVAGDEISWGQRILGLQTPHELSTINNQREITFHNISSYEGYVTYGYIVIGLFGSVVSLLAHKLLRFRYMSLFFPPPRYFFYFFVPAFFNLIFLISTPEYEHGLKGFAEVGELLLYSGISIFIVETYYNFKKTSNL